MWCRYFGQVCNWTTQVRRNSYKHSWYVNEILLFDNNKPVIYNEVLMGPYSGIWPNAKWSEIESMEVSQVLNLVDPPKDLESQEYINRSITDSDEIVLSIKLNSLERCFLASSKGWLQRSSLDRRDALVSSGYTSNYYISHL